MQYILEFSKGCLKSVILNKNEESFKIQCFD